MISEKDYSKVKALIFLTSIDSGFEMNGTAFDRDRFV